MSSARIFLIALFLCAVAVSGCSDGGGAPEVTSNVPSSSTETSEPPASTTAEAEPSTSVPEESVASEVPPAQVTFECGDPTLYQSGTALYSDGTTGYEPSCDVAPPARTLQYCDVGGVAVYSDGTSSTTDPACALPAPAPSAGESGYPYDPSQDRNGDGVVSGYERCGTACGEAPTSGEIQMQYGCEQGWIDPETCAQAGY